MKIIAMFLILCLISACGGGRQDPPSSGATGKGSATGIDLQKVFQDFTDRWNVLDGGSTITPSLCRDWTAQDEKPSNAQAMALAPEDSRWDFPEQLRVEDIYRLHKLVGTWRNTQVLLWQKAHTTAEEASSALHDWNERDLQILKLWQDNKDQLRPQMVPLFECAQKIVQLGPLQFKSRVQELTAHYRQEYERAQAVLSNLLQIKPQLIAFLNRYQSTLISKNGLIFCLFDHFKEERLIKSELNDSQRELFQKINETRKELEFDQRTAAVTVHLLWEIGDSNLQNWMDTWRTLWLEPLSNMLAMVSKWYAPETTVIIPEREKSKLFHVMPKDHLRDLVP